MRIVFSDDASVDYLYWQGHSDGGQTRARVNALIKATKRDYFEGLGTIEPLKGDLKGWWSRRITAEHRMVHRIVGTSGAQQIEIAQLRYHYQRATPRPLLAPRNKARLGQALLQCAA